MHNSYTISLVNSMTVIFNERIRQSLKDYFYVFYICFVNFDTLENLETLFYGLNASMLTVLHVMYDVILVNLRNICILPSTYLMKFLK